MSGEDGGAGRLLTEEELEEWGRRLGRAAARGRTFVALYGPLGAGKSTLVRAAARGAGVRDGPVPSPTYTLVQEHALPGRGTFFHVDLYRVSGGRDLSEIGWDRLLAADGPVFVEWADRAEGALPPDRWEVTLRIPEDRTRRRVRLLRHGSAPRPPRPGATEGGAGQSPAGASGGPEEAGASC